MTTGKEVLSRALQLLGYTNSYGEVDALQDAELIKRGAVAVEQIYNDLQRIENNNVLSDDAFSMNDELSLSAVSVNDIMPYGVAMLLADMDNNGVLQAKFAAIYNQKRAGVPKSAATITDVIPAGGW